MKTTYFFILFLLILSFSGCSKDDETTPPSSPTPPITSTGGSTDTGFNADYNSGTISLSIDGVNYTPYDINCSMQKSTGLFVLSFDFEQDGYERFALMYFPVGSPPSTGLHSVQSMNIVITPAEQTASNQIESLELTTINSTTAIGSYYIVSDQGKNIYGDFNLTN